MYSAQDFIAVFDSGLGGISVLRQLKQYLPQENYLYFGDSANAPYGSRSTGEVRELTLRAVARLMEEYPIKALVVACNTATSAAIEALRAAYPTLTVIGIEPALKLAAEQHPGGTVGVMATAVTLREEKFDALLHRFDASCTVYKLPAPGLVELVEQGKADSPEAEALLRPLLEPYAGKLDALVLGCTHYPFARRTIEKILGPSTLLLDGGPGTARETRRRLSEAGLLSTGGGCVLWCSSGDDPAYFDRARQLLADHP